MANLWDVNRSTQPVQPAATSWYNGGNYGQTQNFYNSPIAGNIREQNPQIAFSSWANRQGVADTDNGFNRWFYQQYPRFDRARQMAILDNPMMTIDQFMQTLPNMQQLQQQWGMQAPGIRGANYAQVSPNARWIPR